MPRYRWTVLAVGALGTAVTGALRQGMPAVGPAFRDAFDLTLPEVGLVFASLTAGITVGLVPWGALADRIGERKVLSGGLAAASAGLAGSALAPGFGALLAGLFVTGFFGASATGSSGRAIMGWFERSERGFALGVRQTAIPLGGAAAALSLPAIAALGGIDAALFALAGFTLVAALAGGVWMREPPVRPVPEHVAALPPPTRDPRIWRLGIGAGLFVMTQAAIVGFVVLFLVDERGMGAGAAAGLLAAMQLGAAATRIAIGRRSDRLDRRIDPLRSAGVVGALLTAAAALLAGAPGVLLYPTLVGAGVAMMSWNGLAFTAAAEISGRVRAGTAMALQNAILSVLGALASPGFGLLVAGTSWRTAYLVAAAAPLVGWLILRPLSHDEDERAQARALRLAAVR